MQSPIVRAQQGARLLNGRQTIKLFSQDTAGRFTILLSVVPAGTGVPPHIHQNEDEMFLLIDGELSVSLNGKEYFLTPNDLIFLPRGIPHGFKAVKDASLWVFLTPGGAEQMFIELAQLPTGPPDRNKIAEICARYAVTFL